MLLPLCGEEDGGYLFDSLGLDDGLLNLSISSVQEDSRGFIWLGTQSGLYRYDGYEFVAFHQDPFDYNSLPHGVVQTLFIDDEDIIWAGTYNGVSRFDPATMVFTNYEYSETDSESLSNNVVTAITKDTDGFIWVGTLGGLNRLEPDTGIFKRYLHDEEDPGSPMNDLVRSLLFDSEGRLWVGNLSGLELYNPVSDSFSHYQQEEGNSESLAGLYVMKLLELPEGKLLVGTWDGGLSILDEKTGRCRNISFPDNRIYSMALGPNEKIWIGTWGGGLYILNPSDYSYATLRHDVTREGAITSDIIYALHRDSSRIMWVGTNGGGVNIYNPQKQKYTFLAHDSNDSGSIEAGKVSAIFEDSSENLWMGIYNAGINVYNPESGALTRFKHDPDDDTTLSNDIISQFYEDGEGNIWVSTNDGLNRFSPDTGLFESFHLIPDTDQDATSVYSEFTVDDDGTFWIGTYYFGLLQFNPGTGERRFYPREDDNPESISDNLVFSVLERENGELWVGTNKGLNLFDRETGRFKRFLLDRSNPLGLNNNAVRALLEDSRGRLWLGSGGGGVSLYDDHSETFTHFTTREGMSSNFIMALSEGEDENIWVATKYGVSIIHEDTFEIEVLDQEDGLKVMEFTSGVSHGRNGVVYLGAVNEVSRFGTLATVRHETAPRVHLISIGAGGTPLPGYSTYLPESQIILDFDNASYLSFEYVALNYLSPDNTDYAYQLEGFDEEWISAGERRFALYTSLPPGEYTFRVKAANHDGVWNEEGVSQRVQVLPPFWMTWWAFLVYFLGLVLIIVWISSLGISRARKTRLLDLEKAQAELEELNRQNELLSVRDHLTGIYNRRYLQSSLEKEFARAQRIGTSISVIMVDIDFFKAYNDNYGHVEGDKCLIQVVEAMKKCINRPNDILSRYGGEEFCIVLPDVKSEGARRITDRMLSSVRDCRISHEESHFNYVTISMGFVSAVPPLDQNSEDFLNAADNALYRAKEKGRNRVEEEKFPDARIAGELESL